MAEPTEAQEKSEPAELPSTLLDMTKVRIGSLASFDHPRLEQAKEELLRIVGSRQVAAGFGSAV